MHPVSNDRSARRAANLLVLKGQHAAGHWVCGIEPVVPEITVDAAVATVCPGSADRLNLNTGGSTLCDVEQGGHNLELGNGFATEFGLAKRRTGHLLRDLLSVQIQLKLVVAVRPWPLVDAICRDSLDHHLQLQPVAPGDRKFFHLTAIDVADDFGGRRLNQRRL